MAKKTREEKKENRGKVFRTIFRVVGDVLPMLIPHPLISKGVSLLSLIRWRKKVDGDNEDGERGDLQEDLDSTEGGETLEASDSDGPGHGK